MVLRLIVEHAGRVERHTLLGECVVGSGREADVRIVDPGVSRRHALLRVDGGTVVVEDLGSLNGTTVGAERTGSGRPLRAAAGERLRFGPVDASLEVADAADLIVAVAFNPACRKSETKGRTSPTLGTADLQRFLLGRMPNLLDSVRQRPGVGAVAGLVGEALVEAVPALGLVVQDVSGGILFRAGSLSSPGVAVLAGSTATIEAIFVGPEAAQTFRPLIEIGGQLLALADGVTVSNPVTLGEPLPLPEPPTLDPRLRRIYGQAWPIAKGDISVLIIGESGTGKELLAQYVHRASGRSGELVALNAAALPLDLLEAELFGVERGVATGVEARAGKIEQADAGTLFLDEIGDMALETQAKLLRVLENGEVARVGGRSTRKVDVRVVSASNRDLDRMRREGDFRDDLYHRIADWRVELPALRDRRVDVANLAAHFLWRQASRRGVHPGGLAESAVEALSSHDWPGNVRQLEREMARVALLIEDGQLLERRHLSEAILRGPSGDLTCTTETLAQRLDRVERETLVSALDVAAGDTASAAQRLGISRSTLYRRMEKYGLAR